MSMEKHGKDTVSQNARKRELHAAVDRYDKDERIELKRKLDMMDANEVARDGEEGAA